MPSSVRVAEFPSVAKISLDHRRIPSELGRRAEAGIGSPDEARQHRPLVLLPCENEIVSHGKLREHLDQLKGAADAEPVEVARPHPGGLPAIDTYDAGGRLQLAEDAVEQR